MNQARNAGTQCFNEALCACVSCLCCCGCYLSDYLERFFWTCKNRCGENGNKNQVDVWFPIVFEAVLPFFGAMLGTTVLYQFQCVVSTSRQRRTPHNIGFVSMAAGWDGFLGFPILSWTFFRGAFRSSSDVSFTKTTNSLPSPECSKNNFHHLGQAMHRVAHFDSLPPTSWGKIRSENDAGFLWQNPRTQRVKIHRRNSVFLIPLPHNATSSQHNNYIAIINYHTISVSSPFWNWGPL